MRSFFIATERGAQSASNPNVFPGNFIIFNDVEDQSQGKLFRIYELRHLAKEF